MSFKTLSKYLLVFHILSTTSIVFIKLSHSGKREIVLLFSLWTFLNHNKFSFHALSCKFVIIPRPYFCVYVVGRSSYIPSLQLRSSCPITTSHLTINCLLIGWYFTLFTITHPLARLRAQLQIKFMLFFSFFFKLFRICADILLFLSLADDPDTNEVPFQYPILV